MIHITHDMLPILQTTPGFVTIAHPFPSDATMTPMIAVAYAHRLIDAAAAAEGDRIIADRAPRAPTP